MARILLRTSPVHAEVSGDPYQVTVDHPSPVRQSGRRGAPNRIRTATCTGLNLIAVWFLAHPYQGIVHDAQLYVGRSLATLRPAGMGRDVMFYLNGQFDLSLFPRLFTALLATLGPSTGALVVSAAGLIAWFVALVTLARRFASGARVAGIIVAVAVLPSVYGGFATFNVAEPMAAPRAWAEAASLLALAMLVSEQPRAALLLLLGALVLHPIMALPALGVATLWLALDDRRWLAIVLIPALVLSIGAGFDLPLVSQLFTPIDTEWQSILERRNPYLFPRLWPGGAWGLIVAQTGTILLAATFVKGRARTLLLSSVAVGAAGLAVTLILDDLYPSVLVTQVQPWRALWLVSVFGALALAVCSAELWAAGGLARVALVYIVLGWAAAPLPMVTISAFGFALFLLYGHARHPGRVRPALIVALSLVALVLPAIISWIGVAGLLKKVASEPGDASLTALLKFQTVPLLHMAVGWAALAFGLQALVQSRLLSAVLVLAAALLWDARSPFQKALDEAQAARELVQHVGHNNGEVLWLHGGFTTWSWLDRPNWVSSLQGAGIVFSRDLAFLWNERNRFLIDQRLVPDVPFGLGQEGRRPPPFPALTEASLVAVCARSDAPVSVVAPLQQGEHLVASFRPALWRAPAPTFYRYAASPRAETWIRMDTYAVFQCSQIRRSELPDRPPMGGLG